jgi:hypothetical protein
MAGRGKKRGMTEGVLGKLKDQRLESSPAMTERNGVAPRLRGKTTRLTQDELLGMGGLWKQGDVFVRGRLERG